MIVEELLERISYLEEENQVLAHENKKIRKELAQFRKQNGSNVPVSTESGGSYVPTSNNRNIEEESGDAVEIV